MNPCLVLAVVVGMLSGLGLAAFLIYTDERRHR